MMNCPECGKELKPSNKYAYIPEFLECIPCKKFYECEYDECWDGQEEHCSWRVGKEIMKENCGNCLYAGHGVCYNCDGVGGCTEITTSFKCDNYKENNE